MMLLRNVVAEQESKLKSTVAELAFCKEEIEFAAAATRTSVSGKNVKQTHQASKAAKDDALWKDICETDRKQNLHGVLIDVFRRLHGPWLSPYLTALCRQLRITDVANVNVSLCHNWVPPLFALSESDGIPMFPAAPGTTDQRIRQGE